MKKFFGKILALALVLSLAISVVNIVPASAEEFSDPVPTSLDYEPIYWHKVTSDKSKTFTGAAGNSLIVNCYATRIVLTGFQKSLAKINKTLKKACNAFLNDSQCEDIFVYAQEAVNEGLVDKDIYHNFVEMDVTYCGSKYISIYGENQWYAGGVGNHIGTGFVFDLETGKQKNITTVSGLSLKKIKSLFIKAVKESEEFKDYYDDFKEGIEAYINALTAKDIDFIIDEVGQISVLIPPYTEGFFGGWTREFPLDGVMVK
ncbi:MAG: hypothetical protein IKP88_16375 [Lachnospiraceae bacterium]|nr:hypothetical protein [Lachnospiraceae bacterium]